MDDFEALKQEAMAWVARIHSGDATRLDGDQLRRWRARSDDHERAFREAATLWSNLGPALAGRARPGRASTTRRAFLASASLAAGAAGISIGLSQLGYLPALSAILSDYSTGVGEQKTVQLPDGSKAELDAATTLSLAFDENNRSLLLSTGAAVFEVADDARPFMVAAGDGISTGPAHSSFSLKHGVEDVAVDCLIGTIDVQCRSDDIGLSGGEGITYSRSGLGKKTNVDPATAAAWRDGLLLFKNRLLSDVVFDINRHRKGRVVIASSELARRRVSGVFHLDRPDEILAQLEETLAVRPLALGGIVLLR